MADLAKFDGTNWTIFNTSNSELPHNVVYSITIDGNGDKWIGTREGLAKFDGTNWTVYNTSNSGLPDNRISSLTTDDNGNTWIGTTYEGLVKFDGTDWTAFNTLNSGLPYNYIKTITIDESGNKWIGTAFGGMGVFNENGILTLPILNVSTHSFTIGTSADSTQSFDIMSNTDWIISCDQNWLTTNTSGGSNNASVTLTAEANPTITTRTAAITVSGTGVTSQTIRISQKGATPVLNVSADTLSIGATVNSTQTVDITSNTDWSISCDQSWLTANTDNGSGNASITLTAEANPTISGRNATVTISGTGVINKTIYVTQEGATPVLNVSADTLSIGATANSTQTVDITSNIDWSISCDQSWLTANTANGSNNASITLTAEANPSATTRTAIITINGSADKTQTILVIQDVGTTSISKTENSGINIFPNPANDLLNITLPPATNPYLIEIFNINGKKVISKILKTDQNKIDISDLSEGIYMIKVYTKEGPFVKKIIIQ